MLVGFAGYLLVGVLAVGVSALFYHYIEVTQNKPYTGLTSGLASAHLVLMNIGAIGAGWLLVYAGFIGGSHLLTSATPPPRCTARCTRRSRASSSRSPPSWPWARWASCSAESATPVCG